MILHSQPPGIYAVRPRSLPDVLRQLVATRETPCLLFKGLNDNNIPCVETQSVHHVDTWTLGDGHVAQRAGTLWVSVVVPKTVRPGFHL